MGHELVELSWWNGDWAFNWNLTLSAGRNVTDAPVMITLNSTNLNYSDFEANGEDLRFIESGNNLSYWIRLWNVSGNSYVYFKPTRQDSLNIEMYGRNNLATDQSDFTSTFEKTGLMNFWGLDDYGNGTVATDYNESCNQGMNVRNATAGLTYVDGKVGHGFSFDGNTSRSWLENKTINTCNQVLATGQFGACAWVKYDNTFSGNILTMQGNVSARFERWGITEDSHNNIFVEFGAKYSFTDTADWHLHCAFADEVTNGSRHTLWYDNQYRDNASTTVGTGGWTQTWIGSQQGTTSKRMLEGDIDEVMFFSAIPSDDFLALLYEPPVATVGVKSEAPSITITNQVPADASTTTSATVDIGCLAEATGVVVLDHAFLYGNFSGSWGFNQTHKLNGSTDHANWTLELTEDTAYNWTCYVNDTTGTYTDWANANYSFFVSVDKAKIDLTKPADNTSLGSSSVEFNCNFTKGAYDLNDSSLYGNFTGAWELNDSHRINGSSDSAIWNLDVEDGSYNWSCSAQDVRSYTNYSSLNNTFIVDITKPVIDIYSPLASISENETIFLNVTADSTIATWWYSLNSGANTSFTPNITLDMTQAINNITVCANDTTNNWGCTQSQEFFVGNISRCGDNEGVNALNFTVLDETNSSFINATFSINVDFWIQNASTNKDYSYSGVSLYNYDFCMYPNWTSMNLNYSLEAETDIYPQRDYSDTNVAISNVTTERLVYLLHSDNGIYARFVTVDNSNVPISDVTSTVAKLIGGAYTTISSGETDGAGLISFWTSPDSEYRFVFQKTGYATQTLFLTPQSIDTYYVNMGGGDVQVNDTQSFWENITYSISPKNSTLVNGTNYTFWFNISSSSGTLEGYSMSIFNQSNILLGSASGVAGVGENLSVLVTTMNDTGGRLYGIYNYTIAGTVKTITSSWLIEYIFVGTASLYNFLVNLVNSTALGMNDTTRGLFAFIIIFSLTAVISKVTGINSSRSIIGFVVMFTWFFSFLNFFTTDAALFGIDSQFMSQFWVAFLITALGVAFMFSKPLSD